MFINLFSELRRAGIATTATFYLNDDPNDMTNYQLVADVGATFQRFNTANPQSAVSKIDGDQEPDHVSTDYLEMNRILANKTSLQVGASLKPAWLREVFGAGAARTALQAALGSLSSGMMMAYSSDSGTVRSLADMALVQAASAGSFVSVAVETSWRAPAADTLWAMASRNQVAFFELLVDLDDHLRRQPGGAYQSLVLHDYEAYFMAMYGVRATDYPTAAVTKLVGT